MQKVTVLLSSYNGSKYIEEQINTIFHQDYDGDIEILIRDDGSVDNTRELIRQHETDEHRKITLITGKNVGPQKSFLELIRKAGNSDYYFFADQDDVWYPEKIGTAVSRMTGKEGAVCYCCNYDLFANDNFENRKAAIQEEPPFRPLKIILYNQIPGCTMAFNANLMKTVKTLRLENVMMHDSMVLSLASAIGSIVFDPAPRIGHRIHGDNVVGSGHKKIIPHKWIAEKTRLVIKKEDYDISRMADAFINTGLVKDQWIDDLKLLRDYKKSWKNTVKLLEHPDSHDIPGDRTTMSIRAKILLHVF